MQQEIRIAGVRTAALPAALRMQQPELRQGLQRGADGAVRMSGICGEHGKAGISTALPFRGAPPQLLEPHQAVYVQKHGYLRTVHTGTEDPPPEPAGDQQGTSR